ncbi:SCP2 sterol-binding domain-containing protein [Saccharopolyspora endophytica]|uniref:SCP2 sterol-binding domain-containing protein n=1 Tax=Saccharopolyspora endophytica TaxID=543886 RepID=A0ABS5DBI7_9PSEU|nr:SCP2 sterol-binding domain-containing protein [Saccharopolyspora endophytica]MBQ0923527.1 SCP2 sterol-binding domain-containing protein [Saccharopolyspora endophytica]
MGVFKDESEVYQYLGRIFQVSMEDPELGPKLRKVGSVLKLNQTDPESTIVIDFGEGVVQLGADDETKVTRPIDAELDMKADVAHRFWLGKVNVALAMAKGDIRNHGKVSAVMKVVPITKPLFATYEKILRDAGREDLVNAVK